MSQAETSRSARRSGSVVESPSTHSTALTQTTGTPSFVGQPGSNRHDTNQPRNPATQQDQGGRPSNPSNPLDIILLKAQHVILFRLHAYLVQQSAPSTLIRFAEQEVKVELEKLAGWLGDHHKPTRAYRNDKVEAPRRSRFRWFLRQPRRVASAINHNLLNENQLTELRHAVQTLTERVATDQIDRGGTAMSSRAPSPVAIPSRSRAIPRSGSMPDGPPADIQANREDTPRDRAVRSPMQAQQPPRSSIGSTSGARAEAATTRSRDLLSPIREDMGVPLQRQPTIRRSESAQMSRALPQRHRDPHHSSTLPTRPRSPHPHTADTQQQPKLRWGLIHPDDDIYEGRRNVGFRLLKAAKTFALREEKDDNRRYLISGRVRRPGPYGETDREARDMLREVQGGRNKIVLGAEGPELRATGDGGGGSASRRQGGDVNAATAASETSIAPTASTGRRRAPRRLHISSPEFDIDLELDPEDSNTDTPASSIEGGTAHHSHTTSSSRTLDQDNTADNSPVPGTPRSRFTPQTQTTRPTTHSDHPGSAIPDHEEDNDNTRPESVVIFDDDVSIAPSDSVSIIGVSLMGGRRNSARRDAHRSAADGGRRSGSVATAPVRTSGRVTPAPAPGGAMRGARAAREAASEEENGEEVG